MIFRALGRLLRFFLALIVGWIVTRALRNASQRPAGRDETFRDPAAVTALVRDRVCNTYLPRSRALAKTIGAEEHFFCSEGCLRAYLDRGAAPGSV